MYGIPDEVVRLFTFKGDFDALIRALQATIAGVRFEQRPYIFELVPVRPTPTFGIWLQDPAGANPYSHFTDQGPFEVVGGLFVNPRPSGLEVVLWPSATNTQMDKMGQLGPHMVKSTENTPDLERKQAFFVSAFESQVKAMNRWAAVENTSCQCRQQSRQPHP